MSTFRWTVEDPSEEPIQVQFGGEVNIAGLSVVKVETWHVESPDATVAIVPETGGTVEPIQASAHSVAQASHDETSIVRSLTADKKLFRIVVLIVLGLVGLAFAGIVVKDIVHDKIDLQTYAMIMLSFVAGRGSKSLANNKDTGQGDGSG
jgi:hypothetical protein